MRLYLTDGEKDSAIVVRWSGTQADARADRKALKEDDCQFIETREIDVPTDKAGLMAFLNHHKVQVGG